MKLINCSIICMCIKLFTGESISVDTIKHSFVVFEKFNCLKIIMNDYDNVKTLSMVINEHGFYENMQIMSDYIEDFVKKIH